MALDQASLDFLRIAAETTDPKSRPPWEMSADQARKVAAAQKRELPRGPEMHQTDNFHLTGWDGGEFAVRVLRPTKTPHSVLVYLHGGGWVMSDIDSFDALGRTLAEMSGATVVMVDYRKAPEYPFPAAVEDSWTAVKWASKTIRELSGDNAPLYVAGDSAGGNLATVVAMRALERGGPDIARQILVYPVTDANFERSSYLAPENQTLLPREFITWFWDQYCPNTKDRMNPEAAPLQAKNLRGVTPALIITAEHDVLVDEGEAYSNRLKEAGVDVEYHKWPGQMHGFLNMVNILPASAEVIQLISSSIREKATN